MIFCRAMAGFHFEMFVDSFRYSLGVRSEMRLNAILKLLIELNPDM